MNWSSHKQLIFGSGFILIVLILIGVPVYFTFFNKPPTCSDGKRNQNETGIDCGGICQRACVQDVVAEPTIMWARIFKTSGGMYNAVAYLQNPNINYIARPVQYSFSVYDKDNVLITLKDGYANVPPTKTFPIFEQGINVGERIPAKVLFKFNEPLVWGKYESLKPELGVSEPVVSQASSTPRIDARVINNTLQRFTNTEVIVIVYGANDNAIASSRTFVPAIESRSEVPVVFTWPEPFSESVTKVEIIPKLTF